MNKVAKKVFVGSKNHVKINAVREAFEKVFPDTQWVVSGFDVDSGVSEQPLSEEETVTGARNRANTLRTNGGADYYVGIEGGLTRNANTWMECGWTVIVDNKRKEGLAASTKIMISDAAYDLLRGGKHTLNDICEQHFSTTDAGKKMGYVGLMSNGAVDRTATYISAVAFALAPFAHPHVFAS